MADEPKPPQPTEPPPGSAKAAKSDTGSVPAGQPTSSRLSTDALSDGTKPTILNPGESHRPVAKGKTSLTSIYRKADIMSTLLTFGGAIIAAALIIGGYVFFTQNNSKKPTAPPGKVTNLSQSDLDKLGAFFNGNSAGSSAQILTISASSLFNNRVAVNSDLKVIGAVNVTGTTTLGALTVDQQSTLGVVDIRGALTVSGPANIQSPASLLAGANVKGDLAVSGNGSFGGSISAGSLSAATISVTTINLGGHLSITGPIPTATPGAAGLTANVSSSSNDTAGTISISATSAITAGSSLVTLNFHTAYPRDPVIVITPIGSNSAQLQPFILPGASSFTIGAAAAHGTGSFAFNYWVAQ